MQRGGGVDAGGQAAGVPGAERDDGKDNKYGGDQCRKIHAGGEIEHMQQRKLHRKKQPEQPD